MMLQKIAVVVVLVVAALAAFIATRPSEFRVSRSRTVSAPPEVVFAHVNDFRRWPDWSPWEKLDPSMKKELSGAPAGPGASYRWAGNDDVGEGRMTILESRPNEHVTIRLEFLKPWTATNTTTFDIAPSGSGTAVTWTMTGTNGFMTKAVSLFMNIDQMVGADFEKGLAGLDSVTAAEAAKRAAAKAPAV